VTPDKSKKDEGVSIRDFRKSDLGDLLDLLSKSFAKEFEIIGFDAAYLEGMISQVFGARGRILLGFMRLSGKDPLKFFVAEAKGRVVGTTVVNRSGKIGYISTVMVHPDYRNKGIATKLVRGAVDYIHGRGMERAILDVVSTNDPAVKVYTRIGFRAFEEVVQLIGETGSLSLQEGGVETRPYVGGDLDDAYDLIMASDEQGHLRAYDFTKKQLEIPFWVRLFHIATQVRFVAVREGKAVGYISASYTTPKEAGIMGTSRVRPADRSQGIELALIRAVVGELKRGGIEKIRMGVPTTRPELLEMARSLGMRDAMTLVGMCTT